MKLQNLFSGTGKLSGFFIGILATFIMTLIMLTGMITGVSPLPEPIPVAIAEFLLGPVPKPMLILAGGLAHFGYGGFNGTILFVLAKGYNRFWPGPAWGVLLWLVMHLVVLPIIGWGLFAGEMDIRIVPATFVLHLIYGAVLGAGLMKQNGPDKTESPRSSEETEFNSQTEKSSTQ